MSVMAVSLLAGLATVAGSLLALILGRLTVRLLAGILGMAAGIMLAVAMLDLFPSALRLGGILPFSFGALSGWCFIWILSRILSSNPRGQTAGTRGYLIKLGYLVAAGIALHDLPEGIAIAAGYAAASELGWLIALAVGMHNIPEGMAMAAPFISGGRRGLSILAASGLVSLVTPLGTALGLLLVDITPRAIAYLLALAGGSMCYIVVEELWPEGQIQGPRRAFWGGVLGVLLAAVLQLLE